MRTITTLIDDMIFKVIDSNEKLALVLAELKKKYTKTYYEPTKCTTFDRKCKYSKVIKSVETYESTGKIVANSKSMQIFNVSNSSAIVGEELEIRTTKIELIPNPNIRLVESIDGNDVIFEIELTNPSNDIDKDKKLLISIFKNIHPSINDYLNNKFDSNGKSNNINMEYLDVIFYPDYRKFKITGFGAPSNGDLFFETFIEGEENPFVGLILRIEDVGMSGFAVTVPHFETLVVGDLLEPTDNNPNAQTNDRGDILIDFSKFKYPNDQQFEDLPDDFIFIINTKQKGEKKLKGTNGDVNYKYNATLATIITKGDILSPKEVEHVNPVGTQVAANINKNLNNINNKKRLVEEAYKTLQTNFISNYLTKYELDWINNQDNFDNLQNRIVTTNGEEVIINGIKYDQEKYNEMILNFQKMSEKLGTTYILASVLTGNKKNTVFEVADTIIHKKLKYSDYHYIVPNVYLSYSYLKEITRDLKLGTQRIFSFSIKYLEYIGSSPYLSERTINLSLKLTYFNISNIKVAIEGDKPKYIVKVIEKLDLNNFTDEPFFQFINGPRVETIFVSEEFNPTKILTEISNTHNVEKNEMFDRIINIAEKTSQGIDLMEKDDFDKGNPDENPVASSLDLSQPNSSEKDLPKWLTRLIGIEEVYIVNDKFKVKNIVDRKETTLSLKNNVKYTFVCEIILIYLVEVPLEHESITYNTIEEIEKAGLLSKHRNYIKGSSENDNIWINTVENFEPGKKVYLFIPGPNPSISGVIHVQINKKSLKELVSGVFPKLTLNGEHWENFILEGDSWTDPGATSDGGETVTTLGSIDVFKIGKQEIIYQATNSSGNIGYAKRVVVVQNRIPEKFFNDLVQDVLLNPPHTFIYNGVEYYTPAGEILDKIRLLNLELNLVKRMINLKFLSEHNKYRASFIEVKEYYDNDTGSIKKEEYDIEGIVEKNGNIIDILCTRKSNREIYNYKFKIDLSKNDVSIRFCSDYKDKSKYEYGYSKGYFECAPSGDIRNLYLKDDYSELTLINLMVNTYDSWYVGVFNDGTNNYFNLEPWIDLDDNIHINYSQDEVNIRTSHFPDIINYKFIVNGSTENIGDIPNIRNYEFLEPANSFFPLFDYAGNYVGDLLLGHRKVIFTVNIRFKPASNVKDALKKMFEEHDRYLVDSNNKHFKIDNYDSPHLLRNFYHDYLLYNELDVIKLKDYINNKREYFVMSIKFEDDDLISCELVCWDFSFNYNPSNNFDEFNFIKDKLNEDRNLEFFSTNIGSFIPLNILIEFSQDDIGDLESILEIRFSYEYLKKNVPETLFLNAYAASRERFSQRPTFSFTIDKIKLGNSVLDSLGNVVILNDMKGFAPILKSDINLSGINREIFNYHYFNNSYDALYYIELDDNLYPKNSDCYEKIDPTGNNIMDYNIYRIIKIPKENPIISFLSKMWKNRIDESLWVQLWDTTSYVEREILEPVQLRYRLQDNDYYYFSYMLWKFEETESGTLYIDGAIDKDMDMIYDKLYYFKGYYVEDGELPDFSAMELNMKDCKFTKFLILDSQLKLWTEFMNYRLKDFTVFKSFSSFRQDIKFFNDNLGPSGEFLKWEYGNNMGDFIKKEPDILKKTIFKFKDSFNNNFTSDELKDWIDNYLDFDIDSFNFEISDTPISIKNETIQQKNPGPFITLKGDNPVNIYYGQTYSDPGAESMATSITVSSDINPYLVNFNQRIIYRAEKDNNVTTIKRFVNVINPIPDKVKIYDSIRYTNDNPCLNVDHIFHKDLEDSFKNINEILRILRSTVNFKLFQENKKKYKSIYIRDPDSKKIIYDEAIVELISTDTDTLTKINVSIKYFNGIDDEGNNSFDDLIVYIEIKPKDANDGNISLKYNFKQGNTLLKSGYFKNSFSNNDLKYYEIENRPRIKDEVIINESENNINKIHHTISYDLNQDETRGNKLNEIKVYDDYKKSGDKLEKSYRKVYIDNIDNSNDTDTSIYKETETPKLSKTELCKVEKYGVLDLPEGVAIESDILAFDFILVNKSNLSQFRNPEYPTKYDDMPTGITEIRGSIRSVEKSFLVTQDFKSVSATFKEALLDELNNSERWEENVNQYTIKEALLHLKYNHIEGSSLDNGLFLKGIGGSKLLITMVTFDDQNNKITIKYKTFYKLSIDVEDEKTENYFNKLGKYELSIISTNESSDVTINSEELDFFENKVIKTSDVSTIFSINSKVEITNLPDFILNKDTGVRYDLGKDSIKVNKNTWNISGLKVQYRLPQIIERKRLFSVELNTTTGFPSENWMYKTNPNWTDPDPDNTSYDSTLLLAFDDKYGIIGIPEDNFKEPKFFFEEVALDSIEGSNQNVDLKLVNTKIMSKWVDRSVSSYTWKTMSNLKTNMFPSVTSINDFLQLFINSYDSFDEKNNITNVFDGLIINDPE